MTSRIDYHILGDSLSFTSINFSNTKHENKSRGKEVRYDPIEVILQELFIFKYEFVYQTWPSFFPIVIR